MARAYALGVVGTTLNALIFGLWTAATGSLTPMAFTVLLAVGWTLSIAGAELWTRPRVVRAAF